MKKKIIASLLTLGACAALVSNANINTVNAATTTVNTETTTGVKTTVSKSYYFDFTSDISNILTTTGIEGKCLNGTGSLKAYVSDTAQKSAAANTTISATGNSINPENTASKTYSSALKLNSTRTLSFTTAGTCSIQLNYVLESDGSTEVNVNGKEDPITGYASSTSVLSVNGLSGSNTFKKTDGKQLEVVEMVVTVQEESTITANAYGQTGNSTVGDNTTQFVRFITVVHGVGSINDLSNVTYEFTFNNVTKTVSPLVVDVIKSGNVTYKVPGIEGLSNDEDYSFENRTDTKYLVYVMAYSDKDHVNSYTGNLTLTVKLGNETLAIKTKTLTN